MEPIVLELIPRDPAFISIQHRCLSLLRPDLILWFRAAGTLMCWEPL